MEGSHGLISCKRNVLMESVELRRVGPNKWKSKDITQAYY